LNEILSEMKELFNILNEIWRAIDLALISDQTIQQRRHRIALANAVMSTLPAKNVLDELRDLLNVLAREIAPKKRGEYIRLWQAIDWIYRKKNDAGVVPENDDGSYKLQLIRINLSHFQRYLRAFDAHAADEFEARFKENVDHRGIAAQIRPLIDDAEGGKGAITNATPKQSVNNKA